jgi:hypothetical protein
MPTLQCSTRARGANTIVAAKFEDSYGVPPSGNYWQMPFSSSTLGEEQNLIESDLLGTGREALDPVPDVINNDGDINVPVDARAFGRWLALMYGNPDASPAAVAAAGMKITMLGQPANNATITINGTAFTAKTSGATGAQFNIGSSIADTVTNIAAVLNASAVAGVAAATYTASGNVLTITHDTIGLAGNAFTVAAQPVFNAKIPTATLEGGAVKHIFRSGGQCLPSMSIEFGQPEIPAFDMNFGCTGNTLRIQMQRSGLLTAQIGLIAQGTLPSTATTGGGTLDPVQVRRFAQSRGEVIKDGVTLASIVGGSIGYMNSLEKDESIRPDGRIGGVDPGMARATGEVTMLWRDQIMDAASQSREPISLKQGWVNGNFSLYFITPRVFLPRPKRSVNGPNGIQRTYNWQASGEGADNLQIVELVNDVASYA